MRKGLTVAIGSVFLLGFATSALATHAEAPVETSVVATSGAKITLDGSVRMRGRIDKHTTKDLSSDAFYDGRVRVGVKAEAGPASAYVQLESNGGTSAAENATTDTYTWGNFNTKPNDLGILQAWINYKPGMFGVKVGHMPLALGNKLFFDHGYGDDAVVAYMSGDGTDAGVLAIKFAENTKVSNSDDLNGYVGYFVKKIGGMTVGLDVTHLKRSDADMKATNIGVNFAGAFGPAKVKADVEYQTGDWSATSKAKGYAAMVDGTVVAGPANVGMTVAYGSGDDNGTDGDNDRFVNFLTDTRYFTTIIGYREAIPYLDGGTNGTAYTLNATKNTGLANLFLVQAHADMKTVCPITKKDLALEARLSYAMLNEVPAGADDDLGIELDLNATWTLAPGLSYKVETAYLVAGDAWKTSATDDPDDAYFLRNGLEFKF